jgi:hypothetical protein
MNLAEWKSTESGMAKIYAYENLNSISYTEGVDMKLPI